MYWLVVGVNYAAQILKLIILIRVLLSWLAPYTRNDFTELIYAISEPMLRPFRNILPMMRIDISPILAYFAINLVRRLLLYIIFY